MAEGLHVELHELIALKRFARRIHYKPTGRAVRAGNHLSHIRGRGMDFAEVRNYQAGDEIRHMEWRVTARTGRPHIKVYQEERERPVVILTDFNPSMYFGTRRAFKSVIAAKLSALIAWTAVKQGDRVGAHLFSAKGHSEFMPRARALGVLPFLASLSEHTKKIDEALQSSQALELSDALLRLRRVVKPGSILVLISDFYHLGNDCEKHLSRLRAHNDILAYHISDPLELTPPPPAIYAVTNGQQELLLDTGNNKIWRDYQDWCSERRLNLQTQLKRLQIQYTSVSAENDLPLLVNQTFPRRQRD